MADSQKLIRDPVHGNIFIEKWICDSFVDTAVFQRLRFVEQSSIRLLFPGARHDRFIHSIGVYHIATKIFAQLSHFFAEGGIDAQDIESMRRCYIIAALLHDCAHSPFSHTGESLAKDYCNHEIEDLLVGEINNDVFLRDFRDANGRHKLHTHEMASAFVGLRNFASEFDKYQIDKEQFARMITGILNNAEQCSSVKIAYNCLIRLLNGFVVDADRLDYLLRDTWATGVCNTSVDVDRLIAGLELEVEKGRVRIQAKSLSCVVNAITARDYIYTWILPHHKVALANLLLSRSMRSLVTALTETSNSVVGNDHWDEAKIGAIIFSPERLLPSDNVEVAGEQVSLISDGDVLYLMKKYIPDDKFVKAYLSRKKILISLWKSYAEFTHIFTTQNGIDKEMLQSEDFWDLLMSKMHAALCDSPIVITNILKIKQTAEDLHKVDIVGQDRCNGDDLVRYDLQKLIPQDRSQKFYFYAYTFDQEPTKVREAISLLRRIFAESLESYKSLVD